MSSNGGGHTPQDKGQLIREYGTFIIALVLLLDISVLGLTGRPIPDQLNNLAIMAAGYFFGALAAGRPRS